MSDVHKEEGFKAPEKKEIKPANDLKAKERFDSAVAKLMAFKPIFGTIFIYLNKIQTRDLPTMAVGPTRKVDLALYYNPEFVLSLTHTELKAVLIHEAMHVLLHHITRTRHFNYNPKAYNISADMAINCHVEGLPEGCFYPKTYKLEDYQSAEWYYKKMRQEAQEQNIPLSAIGEGLGELADDHSLWEDCGDSEVIEEKVRSIAEKAIKEQEKKGWSKVNSGLVSAILEANRPVVNWKKEVRYFINRVVMMGRRSTRSRPNRRYGIQQPGTKKNYTSKLLVAVDTSGSMSDKEIEDCLSEINGMIDHVEVHFFFFDTQIQGEPVHFKKRQTAVKIMGRGGTNFHVVTEYANEHKYDGLIIMTDGFAPFPPKPKPRVLWAVTTQGKSVQFPYGKRVVIEERKF